MRSDLIIRRVLREDSIFSTSARSFGLCLLRAEEAAEVRAADAADLEHSAPPDAADAADASTRE